MGARKEILFKQDFFSSNIFSLNSDNEVNDVRENIARKEILFEQDDLLEAVKPKEIFYNKFKSQNSGSELVWNGQDFDPIPLKDVKPTSSVYSTPKPVTVDILRGRDDLELQESSTKSIKTD